MPILTNILSNDTHKPTGLICYETGPFGGLFWMTFRGERTRDVYAEMYLLYRGRDTYKYYRCHVFLGLSTGRFGVSAFEPERPVFTANGFRMSGFQGRLNTANGFPERFNPSKREFWQKTL